MAIPKKFGDRVVNGPFGEVGYIVKKPGQVSHFAKQLAKTFDKDAEDEKNAKELKRIRGEDIAKNFWSRSDVRSLNAHIVRMVDAGMKAHNDDLNYKRDRLKVMMLKDESDLVEEYIDKAQKTADVAYEFKKKRAEEIESRAADLQESFVKKAYERIFKDNCDELRRQVQQENRKAINEIHLKQIEMKRAFAEMEKEENQIWMSAENASDEHKNARRALEMSRDNENVKNYVSALNRQLEDRERVKTNLKCIEDFEESLRSNALKLKDRELAVRDEMSQNEKESYNMKLLQQLKMNRLMKRRSEDEDKSFGRILIQEDIKAAQREKEAIVDTRAQQRKELITFKESLTQYREATVCAEKEIEAITEEQLKALENKRNSDRREAAKGRKDLLVSCVEDRKRRIHLKNLTNESEKRKNLVDDEFRLFKIKENVDPDLNAIRNETMRRVTLEAFKANEESEKYRKIQKERERIDEENYVNGLKKDDENSAKKIEELLGQPLRLTSGKSVHPFVNILSPSN